MAIAGRLYGPEWRRYADPATDFDVIRLTDPAYASGMTAPHLRQFARRGNFLLHWGERSGSRQVYTIDLKSGESRQISDATALDSTSVSLSADDHSAYFFDGPSLTEVSLGTMHPREMYKLPEGALRSGITVASDGSVLVAERMKGRSRVVALNRAQRAAGGAFSVDGDIDLLMARPRHPQLLYRVGDGVWLAGNDGSAKHKLNLEPGNNGEMLWTPSGRSLVYLHVPDDPKQLITLRENFPDEGQDKSLARTSQFASFSINNDASVFAGASRSRASAYVLILLRVTRRELTLCEHRASDPAMVSPAFSPDSQSVFFVSDRHGKSAIYRVHIEKFVEQTDNDN